MTRSAIEVVHAGSASRDLTDADPRGWRLGGGVTYGALMTARLGLRTAAVMGVDRAAASAAELQVLRKAGVTLRLVELTECPVFRNVETPEGRIQTALATGAPLGVPGDLPASWRDAAAWSFAPVAGELPAAWAELPADGALVALGWQGLLRSLRTAATVERQPPRPGPFVRRADLVGLSRTDVDPLTTIAELTGLLRPGARLVITDGAAGGVVVTVGRAGPVGIARYVPARSDRDVDATGAGDAFLATLLAAAIRPVLLGPIRRRVGSDLRLAAAAGSATVEDAGIAGIPTLAAVHDRAIRDRERRLVVPTHTPAADLGSIRIGDLDGRSGHRPDPPADRRPRR